MYLMVKDNTFHLKSGTRQGCLFSSFLFNTVLNILVSAVRQKEKKAYRSERKNKMSLFVGDMIDYIENSKNLQKTKQSFHNM